MGDLPAPWTTSPLDSAQSEEILGTGPGCDSLGPQVPAGGLSSAYSPHLAGLFPSGSFPTSPWHGQVPRALPFPLSCRQRRLGPRPHGRGQAGVGARLCPLDPFRIWGFHSIQTGTWKHRPQLKRSPRHVWVPEPPNTLHVAQPRPGEGSPWGVLMSSGIPRRAPQWHYLQAGGSRILAEPFCLGLPGGVLRPPVSTKSPSFWAGPHCSSGRGPEIRSP